MAQDEMRDTPGKQRGPGKHVPNEPFEYGAYDKRPAMRKCLRCGRPFQSKGPAHRICDKCRGTVREIIETHENEALEP